MRVFPAHIWHTGFAIGLMRGVASSRYVPIFLGLLLVAAGEGWVHHRSNAAYAVTGSDLPSAPSLVQDLDGTTQFETMRLDEKYGPSDAVPQSMPFSSGPALLISQAVPEIKEGDRGPLVEALQERLTELGYFNGSVTGYFGDITEAAVLHFQRDHGLNPDGIVGSGTTNSLRKAGPRGSQRRNNPLTLEEGDQGPAVETLQNQLTTLGYYDGPITGYLGPLTESALIRFQNDQGLVSDGVVGNATQAAIDSALQSRSSSQSSQTASASNRSSTSNTTDDEPDPNDGVWEVGETGDSVASIQRNLQTLGYYSRVIDGEYGSGTEAAVIAFQDAQNLNADGKAGPITLAALQASLNAQSNASSVPPSSASSSRVSTLPPAASSQSTPASTTLADPTLAVGSGVTDRNVLAVQRQLQDQGYYTGVLDGDLGPATRRAIQSAQQAYGLQRSDFDQ